MNVGISPLQILHRINQQLKAALEHFDLHQYAQCRDRCIKSSAMIDILNNEESKFVSEIMCAKVMLRSISKQLLQQLESARNSFHIVLDQTREDIAFPLQGEISEFEHKDLSSFLFQDIVGCSNAKQSLLENIVFPFKLPVESREEIYRGIRKTTGNILLHGPPGTGKTLLAQAAANESGAKWFTMRPSDVLSKFQGESERYLRKLFATASRYDKAIIFIDELDSIATCRSVMNDCALSRRLLAELLLQLGSNMKTGADVVQNKKRSFDSNEVSINNQLIIIAATNRIEDIDEAVLRRFSCKIYVEAPDEESRKSLVTHYLINNDYKLSSADIQHISNITQGWSASDIETLIREAAMIPLRESSLFEKRNISKCPTKIIVRPIHIKDFENAYHVVIPKSTEEDGDAEL